MAPTVGLSCARAIFTSEIQETVGHLFCHTGLIVKVRGYTLLSLRHPVLPDIGYVGCLLLRGANLPDLLAHASHHTRIQNRIGNRLSHFEAIVKSVGHALSNLFHTRLPDIAGRL